MWWWSLFCSRKSILNYTRLPIPLNPHCFHGWMLESLKGFSFQFLYTLRVSSRLTKPKINFLEIGMIFPNDFTLINVAGVDIVCFLIVLFLMHVLPLAMAWEQRNQLCKQITTQIRFTQPMFHKFTFTASIEKPNWKAALFRHFLMAPSHLSCYGPWLMTKFPKHNYPHHLNVHETCTAISNFYLEIFRPVKRQQKSIISMKIAVFTFETVFSYRSNNHLRGSYIYWKPEKQSTHKFMVTFYIFFVVVLVLIQ